MFLRKLKQALEITSNVVVILAAVAFVAALLVARHNAQKGVEASRTQEASLLHDNLPQLVEPDGKHKLLLIAMSTTCSFCKASVPFYKQLLARPIPDTKVVGLFPQGDGEVKEYEKNMGLSLPFKSNIAFDRMGVVGTPTVILLDASGHQEKSWMGLLSQADRDDLEHRIGL
jgi:thioredoxin-related protein